MRPFLLLVQGTVLLLLVLMVLYFFYPPFHDDCQRAILRLVQPEHTSDTQYDVPVEHRRPLCRNLAHFYETREVMRTKIFLQSRQKFPQQHHTGSVMLDGFHALMPPNTKWQGGKIVPVPPQLYAKAQEKAEKAQ